MHRSRACALTPTAPPPSCAIIPILHEALPHAPRSAANRPCLSRLPDGCRLGARPRAAVVNPADAAENRIIPMYGNLPACDDPAVLGEITSWFNSREAKFWGPLQAVGYDRIRPIGLPAAGATISSRAASAPAASR